MQSNYETVISDDPAHQLFSSQWQSEDATRFLDDVGENPLPGLEVGEWALAELQRCIPILQHIIQTLMSKLLTRPTTFSTEKRTQMQQLMMPWQQGIQYLQTLCQEPPARLIYAGQSIQHAIALLIQLPELPRDLADEMIQLVLRIPPSLTYSRAELESIVNLLSTGTSTVLYEQDATRETLWNALPQATIAHFSCHGYFNPTTPLDSALLLAHNTQLTLRDLLNAEPQQMASLRLVTLSACMTAVIDAQYIPDEVTGLFAGFLQAGVPSVIGTLWSVDDQSTALLMTRFYELYLHGDVQIGLPPQPIARALGLAQCWLRDLTNNDLLVYLQGHHQQPLDDLAQRLSPGLVAEKLPSVRQAILKGQGEKCPYADTYYWAGFVYYGVLLL